MNIVALIPARAGSKRIPGKNTKLLGGKPLIQWTIEAAQASRIFSDILVCTDDADAAILSRRASLRVYYRPPVADAQPDIQWVKPALAMLRSRAFAILRPTSPFRTAATIQRAWREFNAVKCDSIRAVQPVHEHPGKMWTASTGGIVPFLERQHDDGTPWHSSPTQTLPQVYVQNSSLEVARTTNVTHQNSISGQRVYPFFTDGWEGFTIDYPEDWDRAERHVADLQAHPAAQ